MFSWLYAAQQGMRRTEFLQNGIMGQLSAESSMRGTVGSRTGAMLRRCGLPPSSRGLRLRSQAPCHPAADVHQPLGFVPCVASDLQTLQDIGVEKNTTIVFPLPLEMKTLLSRPQSLTSCGYMHILGAARIRPALPDHASQQPRGASAPSHSAASLRSPTSQSLIRWY